MRRKSLYRDERGAVFLSQAIISVFIITLASVGLVKAVYQAHEVLNRNYRRMAALDVLHNEMEYWKMRGFATTSAVSIPALPDVVLDKQNRSRRHWVYAEFEPRPSFREDPEAPNVAIRIWLLELHLKWEETDGTIHQESLRTAINSML